MGSDGQKAQHDTLEASGPANAGTHHRGNAHPPASRELNVGSNRLATGPGTSGANSRHHGRDGISTHLTASLSSSEDRTSSTLSDPPPYAETPAEPSPAGFTTHSANDANPFSAACRRRQQFSLPHYESSSLSEPLDCDAYSNHKRPTTPRRSSFPSALRPRVAVLLDVPQAWHVPLLICRALSTAPAAWWGLRCAIAFLKEALWEEARVSAAKATHRSQANLFALAKNIKSAAPPMIASALGEAQHQAKTTHWIADKQFLVTEVFLAIVWCSASAYLSFFFADCLMSRWLLNYTPAATVVRLLTTNALIAYICSWVLYLSGAVDDRCMLLPAWVAIATTLTVLYHVTQRKVDIKRETSASVGIFSVASFVSMCGLLLQIHLARPSESSMPLVILVAKAWDWALKGWVLA